MEDLKREDNVFKKLYHIELSDGDTEIVSNPNCPLSEKEATEMNIVIPIQEIQSMVPCCVCNASLAEGNYNSMCPNYFGVTIDKDGINFDCALLSPRKEKLEREKNGK